MAKAAKAPAFKIILDTDALAKESLAIVKAVGNQDKRIQAYLLSEIQHIAKHNNTTRLSDFITSLKGKGIRMQAVVAWLVKFGPLDFDEEKQNIKLNKDKAQKLDIQAATDRMWTEEKPEGKLTPFSLNTEFSKLVNKALNLQVNKRDNVTDDVPDTTLQRLLELAEQLGLKIEKPEVKEAANDAAPAEMQKSA